MSAISLSSVINTKFLSLFKGGAAGASTSSSGVTSLTSSGTQVSISETLRVGAQVFASSIQSLNSSISFLNTTKEDLKEILKIAKKVVDIADQVSKVSTGSAKRAELYGEFRKLAYQYEKLVDNAKIGDYSVLDEEDIVGALQLVGLDKETSDTIAAIFKKFYLSEKDESLASEYVKGPRPVHIPYSAYQATVIIPGSGMHGDGSFKASVSYAPSFDGATWVNGGQWTADTYEDFIVSNDQGINELFISQGDGTFTSGGTFGVSGSRTGVVVGDVDNDGIDDVVSVGGTQAVALGFGDGSFGYASEMNIVGISGTLGDFDSESGTDLVTFDANGIYFYRGMGDGNFIEAVTQSISFGAPIHDIQSADFDGDGYQDLAIAADELLIMYGNNDGTFEAPVTYTANLNGNGHIAIGDLNNDSNKDIVVADNDGVLKVFTGAGSGTFNAMVTVNAGGAPLSGLAIKDINGDSKEDVVVDKFSYGGVNVLLGKGNGTFFTYTSFATSGPLNEHGLALIDSQDNGVIDIVTAGNDSTSPSKVSVLLGNGTLGGSTTTAYVPYRSQDYDTLFSEDRLLKKRIDGFYLKVDAEEFQRQIEKNIKAIDYALEVVEKNIQLVRGAGFAFLSAADSVSNSDEAEVVALNLQKLIRQNASAALAQAENLNPIVVATLANISDGISYRKDDE